jgi:4-amino-4-deoxy-L-arabinose transferase-like glycosyltransferase
MIANSNRSERRDEAAAPDHALRLALAIVGAGLLVRSAILPFRWVNPDEGAHLMDARLLLDGLVPLVHYGARQPFYVLLLAGWVRLVGTDHSLARVLPMLAGSATGLLVFLLTRRLFGRTAALWAVALMTFYPFMVIWSTIVHTQPFTVMFCTFAMYLVARYIQGDGGRGVLAFAGATLGLAFYVRESSLAPLLAAALVLLAIPGAPSVPGRGRASAAAMLVAGFAVVGAAAMLLYSHWLGLAAVWASDINPLGIVRDGIAAAAHAFGYGAPATSAATDSSGAFRDPTQLWTETFGYVRAAVQLNAPLIAAVVVAPVLMLSGDSAIERRDVLRRLALPLAWIACLCLLYGYWLLRRGFYPQYSLEFLPPLAALGGVALARFPRAATLRAWIVAVVGVVLFALVAVAHHFRLLDLSNVALVGAAAVCVLAATNSVARRPMLLAASVVALIAAEFASARLGPGRSAIASAAKLGLVVAAVTVPAVPWLRRRATGPGWPRLGAGLVLAATLLFAAAASGRGLSLAYECVWSPATVRAVARAIASRAAAGDQVLSGGVIWDFDSGLRPVANISHPLSFITGIPPRDEARLGRALAAGQPRFVVLDGYTEQTYLPYSARLETALSTRYRMVGRFSGSEYPVFLYVRAE